MMIPTPTAARNPNQLNVVVDDASDLAWLERYAAKTGRSKKGLVNLLLKNARQAANLGTLENMLARQPTAAPRGSAAKPSATVYEPAEQPA